MTGVHRRLAALLAAVSLGSVGCGSGSGPIRATLPVIRISPKPPSTHDGVALYNDTSSTVRVVGCAGCGSAGEPVTAGEWLALNLPPDSSQLKLVRPGVTTCLIVMSGVDTGRPVVVKVSESAASAC